MNESLDIENNPHLTAIKRVAISSPVRWLKEQNKLKGRILDFGCGYGFDTDDLGKQGFDIIGYDSYYRQELPKGKFDTILCIYVLNVLKPLEQADVLMSISHFLEPQGTAYIAVRRDIKEDGFRFHPNYKKYTYQCDVELPFNSLVRNSGYEIYEYRHYNQLKHEYSRCPFCNLARRVELICETTDVVAFYDGYPVSKGHALIIPKRHVANYFDLTMKEIQSMQFVLKRVQKILESRFHPDGFNIGINVGKAGGQSISHVHLHLIPRYKGDVEKPKGGVRGVIPSKQNY